MSDKSFSINIRFVIPAKTFCFCVSKYLTLLDWCFSKSAFLESDAGLYVLWKS